MQPDPNMMPKKHSETRQDEMKTSWINRFNTLGVTLWGWNQNRQRQEPLSHTLCCQNVIFGFNKPSPKSKIRNILTKLKIFPPKSIWIGLDNRPCMVKTVLSLYEILTTWIWWSKEFIYFYKHCEMHKNMIYFSSFCPAWSLILFTVHYRTYDQVSI